MKHFEIPLDARNPGLVRRLETRVMICTAAGGKYGLTYKWNANGTDAVLLVSGDEDQFQVTLEDGSMESRTWSFPSRGDCMLCHTPATGQALGLRTHQMNRLIQHPTTGQPVNQLTRFNSDSMFTTSYSATQLTAYLASKPLDDTAVPEEHRVRSYLDSNCSQCHQPGSSAPFFDARLQTPLRGQNLINGILDGRFGLGSDGRYLKPGAPLLSAIHVRTASAVPGIAMPPLGKHVVDQAAANLIEGYIAGLTEEEFQSQPTPLARYLRLTSLSGTRAAIAELSILDGRSMPIPHDQMSIGGVSSEEAVGSANRAIDGDLTTSWISASTAAPHHLTMDLGLVREIGGFIYLPRQDSSIGRITSYQLHHSQNGVDWVLATSGTWSSTSTAAFRYDELNKPRPVRCQISGPPGPVRGDFNVTILFDSAVQDFLIGDLVVNGGTAHPLTGKGYYYTTTVTPSNPAVTSPITITVPSNSVNSSGLGSKPAAFTVISEDTVPPTRIFTDYPDTSSEAFEMNLEFSEAVTGVGPEDFQVENGTVEAVAGTGMNYILTILPYRSGDLLIVSLPGGIQDAAGNQPVGEVNAVSNYLPYRFTLDAINFFSWSGFLFDIEYAGDTSQSFVHVPDGWRGGIRTLDPNIKVTYQFNIPKNGNYAVRGLVRADNLQSASFYVGVDGQSSSLTWLANRGAGEIGSGLWHWGLAKNTGSEHVFNLNKGIHTVEIYGRDDGTQLGRIELIPFRPYPMWGEIPILTNSSPFRVPLTFTSDVTGLQASDFVLTGGHVSLVEGQGREYQITIVPSARNIDIDLPASKVVGNTGSGNTSSLTWRFIYRHPYEQWALDAGLDDSAAGALSDTDHDGVEQILEFAFGLNPWIPDHGGSGPDFGLPKMTVLTEEADTRLTLRYVRRKNVPGLVYQPQFSNSPSGWINSDATPVVEEIDDLWEKVTVKDEAATGAEARRFGRVQVGLPDN